MILIGFIIVCALIGFWGIFCMVLALRDVVIDELDEPKLSSSEALRRRLFEIHLHNVLAANHITTADYANDCD